jgi:antitoxin (DNA-binding transcriptional repressor) of toxin-antitoxin stability system
MSREQGSSLLETLVIWFAVVLVVGQALVTLGRLDSAATRADEAAQTAAAWAARHGDTDDALRLARNAAPGAHVGVERSGDELAVVVTIDVPLVGPAGSSLTRAVHGRAVVRISPYRSEP